MSRLTKQVKLKGATSTGLRQEFPAVPRESCAAGVIVDGVVTPLGGEPPVATSQGWGNLAWLLWRR